MRYEFSGKFEKIEVPDEDILEFFFTNGNKMLQIKMNGHASVDFAEKIKTQRPDKYYGLDASKRKITNDLKNAKITIVIEK